MSMVAHSCNDAAGSRSVVPILWGKMKSTVLLRPRAQPIGQGMERVILSYNHSKAGPET